MVNLPHWPKVPIWQNNIKKVDFNALRMLLSALDNPHKKLPPTIHIAGTNGKGSTLAMIRSIFQSAGYKVHAYTSPHLLEFNERINLAGENISDSNLFELLEEVRVQAEKLDINPHFFQGTTIAAFLAFSRSNADLLLLETGMGGRLDATNLIENPILTIITPISFDHMEHLGNKIADIAIEKAGIIKANTPCIISMQMQQVYEILLARCSQLESSAFCYEYDYVIEPYQEGLLYKSKKYSLKLPFPAMAGAYQYLNAATALTAAICDKKPKFNITSNNIIEGLTTAKWPGRVEKIAWQKYEHLAGKNIDIYLDGAHNDAAAYVLTDWISNSLKFPTYIIIGMTRNRNIESFCQPFKNLIAEMRAVKILSEPLSYHPDIISDRVKKCDIKIKASNSLEDAIIEINNLSKGKEVNLVITGSLFLISDFYKLIL